jgi:hypothetical protein
MPYTIKCWSKYPFLSIAKFSLFFTVKIRTFSPTHDKVMFPGFKRTHHCASILHLTNDLTCVSILAQDASELLNENVGFFKNCGHKHIASLTFWHRSCTFHSNKSPT